MVRNTWNSLCCAFLGHWTHAQTNSSLLCHNHPAGSLPGSSLQLDPTRLISLPIKGTRGAKRRSPTPGQLQSHFQAFTEAQEFCFKAVSLCLSHPSLPDGELWMWEGRDMWGSETLCRRKGVEGFLKIGFKTLAFCFFEGWCSSASQKSWSLSLGRVISQGKARCTCLLKTDHEAYPFNVGIHGEVNLDLILHAQAGMEWTSHSWPRSVWEIYKWVKGRVDLPCRQECGTSCELRTKCWPSPWVSLVLVGQDPFKSPHFDFCF